MPKSYLINKLFQHLSGQDCIDITHKLNSGIDGHFKTNMAMRTIIQQHLKWVVKHISEYRSFLSKQCLDITICQNFHLSVPNFIGYEYIYFGICLLNISMRRHQNEFNKETMKLYCNVRITYDVEIRQMIRENVRNYDLILPK